MKKITDKMLNSFLIETLEDIHEWNYKEIIILNNCQEDLSRKIEAKATLIKLFKFAFYEFQKRNFQKGCLLTSKQINSAINFIYEAF